MIEIRILKIFRFKIKLSNWSDICTLELECKQTLTNFLPFVKFWDCFLNYYLVGTPGRNQNLHLSFSSREFNLFFSAVFLIGLKWAKTLTKSQKLTTSRSDPVPPFSAEMSLIPLAPSWPSRKNAWTILSHNGLMANSGIRRKSSRVK